MSQQQRKRKSVQDTFQPNKRVVLTYAQKRQLCLDSQKTPHPTQEELAVLYKVKQNTVSDIFKKKEKWLLVNPDSEDANKQKERPVYFPQVEEAFHYGRHNLKEYIKWGEAKSAPLETLDEERDILREIIKDYDLNDVFNCDETGLYWDLEPSKTLAQGPLSGKKKSKKRAQYRKLLVRNRIEAYEISQELNKKPTPINIHDSIDFKVNAWNSVSQQTINNCWKHTGILPINEMDEIDEIED
ncbi:unnamed protein product [Rhizophagus irregularis]|nr:unnamed protein product [Rhizophagus irregularis]